MRIAQLAPLWETVPPKTYGGTELVVQILCEEMVKKGHEVTLFATADSATSADLVPVIDAPMRELNIKNPIYHELQAIAEVMKRSKDFDIIHNHLGLLFLPFAELLDIPVVTTLHGAFLPSMKEDKDLCLKYKTHPFISISDSQRAGFPNINYVSTVYNGIHTERFDFNDKPNTENPYLCFLGRLSPEKGAHHAIRLAKETGHRLIMAGKIDGADVDYYENEIKHLIDGKQIIYIGEVAHKAKNELLREAKAVIHPVTWPEPFGLVMAESMACGTPVLALSQGSIPEVIKDGKTGFVENNIEDLIKRVKDIPTIDRRACRQHVERNFSAERMSDGYLDTYKKLIQNKFFNVDKLLESSMK
ncbi:MAG: glycosyltransferase family 4 protein [bacterium]